MKSQTELVKAILNNFKEKEMLQDHIQINDIAIFNKNGEVIEFRFNKVFQHFEEVVNNFPNIEKIDISHKKLINSIPQNIDKLNQLKHFKVVSSDIKKIPISFGNLPNLEYLELSENKISDIPSSFENLHKLKVLKLNNNKIRKLSSVITNLPNIEIIELRNNKIEDIDNKIKNLTSLYRLELQNNLVSVIPAEIANLKKLTHLLLKGNPIMDMPPSFSKLKDLVYLEINPYYGNNLVEWIGGLSALEHLELYADQVTTIPPSFEELSKMRELILITSPEIDVSILPNLQKLELLEINCHYPEISWPNLSNLIDLTLNNAKKIDFDKVCQLLNLKILRIYYSDLKEIPSCLGSIDNLRTLIIENSKLNELPPFLQKLYRIRIRHSNLIEIPSFIDGMKKDKSRIIEIEGSDSSLLKPGVYFSQIPDMNNK